MFGNDLWFANKPLAGCLAMTSLSKKIRATLKRQLPILTIKQLNPKIMTKKIYNTLKILFLLIISTTIIRKCICSTVLKFEKSNILSNKQRSLSFVGCSPDKNNPLKVNRKYSFKFMVEYKSTHSYKKLVYIWNIFKNGQVVKSLSTSTKSIEFQPYVLNEGNYIIECEAREFQENNQIGAQEVSVCYFVIGLEKPIAFITGGNLKQVRPEDAIVLDGSFSRDLNFVDGRNDNLEYEWTCTNSNEVFTTSSIGFAPGTAADCKLRVSSQGVWSESMEQKVVVTPTAKTLEIWCVRNCIPLVYIVLSDKKMEMEVRCVAHCTGNEQYTWYKKFLTGANEVIGNTSNLSVEKKFGYKQEYIVTVEDQSDEAKSTAQIRFVTGEKGRIKDCQLYPTTGFAFETLFKIDCEFTAEVTKYRIFAVSEKDKSESLLVASNVKEHLFFYVPPNSDLLVKITDILNYTDVVSSKIKVKERGAEDDSHEKLFGNRVDMIKNQILNGNIDYAIQFVYTISQQLTEHKSDEETIVMKRSYQKILLDTISKIELTDFSCTSQIASAVVQIIQIENSESNPEVAVAATEKCREASEAQFKLVKELGVPPDIDNDIKNLIKCSEANVAPNLKLAESEFRTDIPTPFPPITEPTKLVENYPDYLDFVVEEKFAQLNRAAENIGNICRFSGKTELAKSDQKKPVVLQSKEMSVAATVSHGNDLKGVLMENSAAKLSDVKNVPGANSVEVVMCTLPSPFWFADLEEPPENVIMLTFDVNNKQVKKFGKPFQVEFKPNKEPAKLKRNNITIGDGNAQDSTKRNVSFHADDLLVFRFLALDHMNYFVDFENIQEEKFDILISHFNRPTMKQFLNSTDKITVSKENSKIFQENSDHFGFHYLGIDAKSVKSPENLIFFVYTPMCRRWNFTQSKWEPSCKVSKESTPEKIVCICYQASYISSTVLNNRVYFERLVQADFTMEWETNNVVQYALLFAVAIYCLYFPFWVYKFKVETNYKHVYFLSDVKRDYQYMYLAIVETGSKYFSGTTSNVMIKVHGDSSSSDAHVLNFPDPDNVMLQRCNADWFVFGTKKHLGELTNLELWYDHIGINPEWYCETVTIFDIQLKKNWTFHVDRWFRVDKKINTYMNIYTIKADNTKSQSYFKRFWTVITRFKHKRNTWKIFTTNADTHMHFTVRVNLMMSVTLMLFYVTDILYHLPSFKKNYGFAATQHFGFQNLIFPTVVAPCLCFLFHLPLVYFFRNSLPEFSRAYVQRKYSHTVRKVCWFVLCCNIAISLSIVMLFGIRLPQTIAYMWLISVVLGMLIYILVLENLFFVLVASLREKKWAVFENLDTIIEAIEVQREVLYKQFGHTLLRPLFEHLYTPMDEFHIQKRRVHQLLKRTITERLWDLLNLVTFVTIVYLLIIIDRSNNMRLSYNEITYLIDGKMTRTISHTRITSYDGIATYLKKTLIPAVQSSIWYEPYLTNEPGLTVDMTNKYMSIMRLRQHRTWIDSCQVPEELSFIPISVCNDDFANKPEYRDLNEKWSPVFTYYTPRLAKSWKYQSARETGCTLKDGYTAYFPGGGYVIDLGRTQKNSLINLHYLTSKNWIDGATRCIFIDFLMYNVNSNLFNAVTIMIEVDATSFVQISHVIYTARMVGVQYTKRITKLFVLALSLLIVLVFIVRNAKLFYKKRLKFFKDFWKIVDLTIILTSMCIMVLLFLKVEALKNYISDLKMSKNNDFINYYQMFVLDYASIICTAFLITVLTIRLWKLLRFKVVFRVMEKSIIFSLPAFICLSIYFWNILVAASIFFYTLHGRRIPDFRNFPKSIVTLFLLITDFYDGEAVNELEQELYLPTKLPYIIFMIFCKVVDTLFEAILMYHYIQASTELSNQKKLYDEEEHIQSRIKYYFTLISIRRNRLISGQDPEVIEVVYPKNTSERYANSIEISKNKLQLMKQVVLTRIKKSGEKLFNYETMKSIVDHYEKVKRESADDEDVSQEIFFTAFDDKFIRIVSDERLLLMQFAARFILTPPHERAKKTAFEGTSITYANACVNSYNKFIKNIKFRVKNY